MLTLALSVDGVNWFPAGASGPASVMIRNTNSPTGSTTVYDTEMLQLNLAGNSPFGPLMIRESPTKQSLGRHTIGPDPRGFRVSSFFDVFLELSTDDGQTWFPANRSIRLLPSLPPIVPGSIFIKQDGTNVVLQWQNNFILQSTTNLLVPFTDVLDEKGPVTSGVLTNPIVPIEGFFRLRSSQSIPVF